MFIPKKERSHSVRRKRVLLAALLALAVAGVSIAAGTASASRNGGTLTGAGSTFVAPLVSLWSSVYHGSTINYSPVGSGAGIGAISNRQVDFGASDAPLTKDQFSACHGCVQIPWALSGTSVPYNVNGVPDGLHMTGQILAQIFLGKVTKWNNPAIKALNPGVKLPGLKITPIYRSDASGTTFNFTEYLSKVSSAFKSQVGKGTQVNFPVGISGKGSSGVAAQLNQTNGGITYVDVAYSLKNGFKYFKVKNKAGTFTFPTIKSITAARKTVTRVPRSNEISIVDPPASKANAYPICTFTYVIVPLKSSKAAVLKKFIGWAVTKGQSASGVGKLLFVPIGKVVQTAAQKTLTKIHS